MFLFLLCRDDTKSLGCLLRSPLTGLIPSLPLGWCPTLFILQCGHESPHWPPFESRLTQRDPSSSVPLSPLKHFYCFCIIKWCMKADIQRGILYKLERKWLMMILPMLFGIQNTTCTCEGIEGIFIWMSSPSNFNMTNRPFYSPKSGVASWPCEFFMLIWNLSLELLKYQWA